MSVLPIRRKKEQLRRKFFSSQYIVLLVFIVLTTLTLTIVQLPQVFQVSREQVYTFPYLSAPNYTQHQTVQPDPPIEVTWEAPDDIKRLRSEDCTGRKTAPNGGFCLTKGRYVGGNQRYDENLAHALASQVIKGGTVVDLGAGLGHYGKLLLEDETDPVAAWEGYDGAVNVEEVTDGLIKYMDLTQPAAIDQRPCGGQADWVLSLEVAEHIPPEHTDAFLRNIRCRARVGAIISWAVIDQLGLAHINNKREEDAIAAVERWGFKADMEVTKAVRAEATLGWFKRTVVVYRL